MTGTRRPYLTGHAALRGIAAIAVFFAHLEIMHLWPGHSWWMSAYERLFFWHNEGVDLFFVLSGFILFYVHPPQQSGIWRDYFAARVGKIYPFYLATTLFMGAMLVLGALRKHEPPFSNLDPARFLANLLGVQQWTLAGDNWNSLNLPSWSISVELLLYVSAWPLLRLLFRNCRVDARLALALCVILLAAASGIHRIAPEGSALLLASWMSLLRGFVCFAAGAFLYIALQSPKAAPPAALFPIGLALFALSALDFLPRAFLPLFSLPLLWCVSTSNAHLGNPVAEKVCLLLGDLSYGIYLLHFPLIKLTRTLTGVWSLESEGYNLAAPLASKLAFLALTILATFLGAWLGFKYLETPARKWIRRTFGNKRHA